MQDEPGAPSVADIAHVEAWIFDLDNTLYPAEAGLFDEVQARMQRFIVERLGYDPEGAETLRAQLLRDHETTLRGLMVEHGVDPYVFMDFVHDVDLGVLRPNPALRPALAALPGRKLVFTNGSVAHAERILKHLAIDDLFEAIDDLAASEWTPKPNAAGLQALVRRRDLDPAATAMVEDMAANLAPAKALGMTTILVRTHENRSDSVPDHVDYAIDDLAAWLLGLEWGKAAPAPPR